MTDEAFIRRGLIELIIHMLKFDRRQADATRIARANDSVEELVAFCRRIHEHEQRLRELPSIESLWTAGKLDKQSIDNST